MPNTLFLVICTFLALISILNCFQIIKNKTYKRNYIRYCRFILIFGSVITVIINHQRLYSVFILIEILYYTSVIQSYQFINLQFNILMCICKLFIVILLYPLASFNFFFDLKNNVLIQSLSVEFIFFKKKMSSSYAINLLCIAK